MIQHRLGDSRQARGFSLIELGVVLAISAAIGLALWRLLPAMRSSTVDDAPQAALVAAQQALEGYVLRANRLPRPDTSAGSTGFEDAGGVAQVGMLPYRTLGMASDPRLRYGVYRNSHAAVTLDADLAVTLDRYVPTLPVPSGVPANGLDFCVALKNGFANPSALTAGAQSVPVAYALAHRGTNGVFDGLNSTAAGFELAAAYRSATYDDRVLTSGLAELFGRLNCQTHLSAAEGAARDAFATFDVERSAVLYQDFRAFSVRARISTRDFAIAKQVIATVDAADSIAAGVTAIAIAAQTAGIGAAVVAGAVVPAGLSVLALAAATAALVLAVMAVDKANDQKAAADAFRSEANTLYVAALARARSFKRKGLLP